MIRWLLRALGVHAARPVLSQNAFPETRAERNYERTRQEAERVIARADHETERSRRQMLSWESLYQDPRARR